MTSPRVRWIAERLAAEELERAGLRADDRLHRDMAMRWLPVATEIAAEIERHVRAECVRRIEAA